jgi:hypothetical protein
LVIVAAGVFYQPHEFRSSHVGALQPQVQTTCLTSHGTTWLKLNAPSGHDQKVDTHCFEDDFMT